MTKCPVCSQEVHPADAEECFDCGECVHRSCMDDEDSTRCQDCAKEKKWFDENPESEGGGEP